MYALCHTWWKTDMLRWSGTFTYLIGMVLTSLNIYPLNLVFGCLGGALWCLVGVHQKDKALIVVEAASAGIYLFGILNWSLK
jgi:hypothetical protein